MTRFVYIAGAYRADTIEQRDANIAAARAVAVEAVKRGCYPITPHLLTGGMDGLQPDEFFLVNSRELLDYCDELWLVPGWEDSKGTAEEVLAAKRLGLIVREEPWE